MAERLHVGLVGAQSPLPPLVAHLEHFFELASAATYLTQKKFTMQGFEPQPTRATGDIVGVAVGEPRVQPTLNDQYKLPTRVELAVRGTTCVPTTVRLHMLRHMLRSRRCGIG